jgi:yjeF N-terminal region
VRDLVRVVTSSESAARDASAIASGIPSRALMQRAGASAAAEIALRYRDKLARGVLVFAGPGNNGGDAWVVARALAATGARVRVIEPIAAKTPDAIAERDLALDALDGADIVSVVPDSLDVGDGLVIDGLLGTGASGAPRGDVARLISLTAAMQMRDATVISLDVPSGLDASTGRAHDVVIRADLTLSFGTVKRGHLINRELCGAIAVLDIGLGAHAFLDDDAPLLVDEAWVGSRLPGIPASAHKGRAQEGRDHRRRIGYGRSDRAGCACGDAERGGHD